MLRRVRRIQSIAVTRAPVRFATPIAHTRDAHVGTCVFFLCAIAAAAGYLFLTKCTMMLLPLLLRWQTRRMRLNKTTIIQEMIK